MKIIKNFFKVIIKPIISLWNIYGGIILSIFIGWLIDYNKNSMDTITSFIIMTLSCIGALTFIKIMVFKKKPTQVDKIMTQQMSIKSIKNAIDPVASGEELGKTIITTTTIIERSGKFIMKKVLDFFKKAWGNKFTIISISGYSLVCIIADYLLLYEYLVKFEWFLQNQLIIVITVIALTLLLTFIGIFTIVTKYGWESLNELAQRKREKAEYKASQLTSEQKHVLKNQISVVQSGIKDCEAQIKTFKKIIDNFEVLRSVGINPTNEKVAEYNNAITQNQYLEQSKITFENELQRLKDTLNK